MPKAKKEEEFETIFSTRPSVAPRSGFPMPEREQYRVTKRMAHIRYQRGVARPAAEVYLERLRALGVVGIVVSKDAEPSVRIAARKVGVASKPDGSKAGADANQDANPEG